MRLLCCLNFCSIFLFTLSHWLLLSPSLCLTLPGLHHFPFHLSLCLLLPLCLCGCCCQMFSKHLYNNFYVIFTIKYWIYLYNGANVCICIYSVLLFEPLNVQSAYAASHKQSHSHAHTATRTHTLLLTPKTRVFSL